MNTKNIILPLLSVFIMSHLHCGRIFDHFDPTGPASIEGNYLLTKFCMAHSESSGSDAPVLVDSMLQNADCASELPIEDLMAMSTLIITRDSIVRFGYHCPGDNSGSTRIAYGYRYINGQLFGDSLSGTVEYEEGTLKMSTYLEKHPDQSITITQVGKIYSKEIDSTFMMVYTGDYDNYDSTYFKYDDEATCIENYGPWFPMPFW